MQASLGGKWVGAQVYHVVGSDRGWNPSIDMASWSFDRSFRVGDKIWFAYSVAQESIVELKTKVEYESCDMSNSIRMYSDKYWQNVQLYTFGAIFNMARLVLDDFRGGFEKRPWWQRLFNGYSVTTWMVVLNLGSTRLLVSWLMKYADNIVKVYSISMAMLLTMVLSEFFFSFKASKSNSPCFKHGLYVHQNLLQQSFL